MFWVFHHFISNLIRLFFVKQCVICQKNASLSFCKDCLESLAKEASLQSEDLGTGKIFYLYSYHPKIKILIAKIKYGKEPELLIQFLELIKDQFQAIDRQLRFPIYAPVPLHIQKLLKRKFNQAELIAQALSPTRTCRLVKRIKETQALHGLNKTERKKEIELAFAVASQAKPYTLCLVDDIFTTGSTLKEISKLFPDTKLNYFCLAKTPLRL
jgi:ComF family protein